jgi:hypothetical protein
MDDRALRCDSESVMRAATLSLLLSACAARGMSSNGSTDEGALARWVHDSDRAPSSHLVRRDVRAITAPVHIAHRSTPHAPRGPVVDARFERAPLASALRLLAESAGLGLVVGDGVEGEVSIDLRGVRPLIAMQVLADAHGVDLEVVGRTVIVRGRL